MPCNLFGSRFCLLNNFICKQKGIKNYIEKYVFITLKSEGGKTVGLAAKMFFYLNFSYYLFSDSTRSKNVFYLNFSYYLFSDSALIMVPFMLR